jgi:subtilisin family serine protease
LPKFTRAITGIVAALTVAAVVAVQSPSVPMQQVIVREAPGAGDAPEHFVADIGGSVLQPLDIIDGFVAEVPADDVARLAARPDVIEVTEDSTLSLLTDGWDEFDDPSNDNYLHYRDLNTNMEKTAAAAGALNYWYQGYLGDGIDIALIDSGVVPVTGLTTSDKVINGPDLSFESQDDDLRYLDTYGHGTHLAGIIAGQDVDTQWPWNYGSNRFFGIAPHARIINVKVANAQGAADVSQVIAAIDWVVQHRHDNGMNIRVINLAFGTDSTQSYLLDPLAYAVEQAWHQGIVVVVAAGNDGNNSLLRNPAIDPYVIAVGASDTRGTPWNRWDDTVTSFTSCGTYQRHVDVLAPGRSIVSLRNPGSLADVDFPDARVDSRFFKGSGTSQAAAVVSGSVALILDREPWRSPDEVKALLTSTAVHVNTSSLCQGSGVIDLINAMSAWHPYNDPNQYHARSTGTGSLEAARGSSHLEQNGVELTGEQDIFGNAWDGVSWSQAAAAGVSWSGGEWNGASWSGASWSGVSWSGASWSSVSWSGASWSGVSWSSVSWSNGVWTGNHWTGASWSSASWSSVSWSGDVWSGLSWN